jgi:peptidoglycan/LPS O-acetylase OafA/YrhL
MSDRRTELDGLRAVAILAVFGAHAEVLPGGHLGVVVFFVLSGYLITGLLLREATNTGTIDFRRFFVRRAARLFPALVLVLAVTTPLVVWMDGLRAATGLVSALTYSTDVVAAVAGGDSVGHLSWAWTLSLEEQFYLVWPLLLLLFFRRGRRVAPWLLLVVVGCEVLRIVLPMSGEPPSQLYFAPWSRVDALAAGCVLAVLPGRIRLRGKLGAGSTAAAVAGLVLLILLARWTGRVTYAVYMPLAVLASAVLLFGLLQRPHGIVARMLRLRPVAYVGRISYGLYLWNIPVISVIWALPLATVPSALVWVVGTIGVASASFHLVELPLQRWINEHYAAAVKRPDAATGVAIGR